MWQVFEKNSLEFQIRIPDFRLQLWPGYTTSIRQHESNLLMMAEVKHKLMRDENLLDILRRCHAENRNNYQQAYVNMVVGSVVLARYDNRTYRIADVDFTMNPTNTFEKNGQQISFIDYFRGVLYFLFSVISMIAFDLNNNFNYRKSCKSEIMVNHCYTLCQRWKICDAAMINEFC